MGYTHYWSFNKPGKGRTLEVERAYQRAIKACTKIAQAYQAKATGDERLSGYTAFTSNYGGIKLNGKEDNMHEDFCMREHFRQNETWQFCKTARKPYDIVVTACLATMKFYLKDNFTVDSDGYKEEWDEGVKLARKVLKALIKNPITKRKPKCECGRRYCR